jgi:hypothetical protein
MMRPRKALRAAFADQAFSLVVWYTLLLDILQCQGSPPPMSILWRE